MVSQRQWVWKQTQPLKLPKLPHRGSKGLTVFNEDNVTCTSFSLFICKSFHPCLTTHQNTNEILTPPLPSQYQIYTTSVTRISNNNGTLHERSEVVKNLPPVPLVDLSSLASVDRLTKGTPRGCQRSQKLILTHEGRKPLQQSGRTSVKNHL